MRRGENWRVEKVRKGWREGAVRHWRGKRGREEED